MKLTNKVIWDIDFSATLEARWHIKGLPKDYKVISTVEDLLSINKKSKLLFTK